MAFCKYCGRQLNDGEICNCNSAQQQLGDTNVQNVSPQNVYSNQWQQPPVQQYQQPYQQGVGGFNQQPYYVPQAPRNTSSKASIFLNIIKGYFKSPAKTKNIAINNSDISSAIISLAIYVVALIVSLFSYQGAISIKTGMEINVGLTFLFALLFGVIFFGIQFLSILFYSLYSGKRGVAKSIFIYCAVGKIFPSMLIIFIGLVSLLSPIVGAILFIVPATIMIVDTFHAQITFGKEPEKFGDFAMLVFLGALAILLVILFVSLLLTTLFAKNVFSSISSFDISDLLGGFPGGYDY